MGILSEEGIAFLTETFNEIDTDKSGFIEHGELETALSKVAEKEGFEKPSKDEIDARIAAMDTSGDGKIDIKEYLEFAAFMKVMMIVGVIFKQVDTDNSGFIEANELKNVLISISEGEVGENMPEPTDEQVAEYLKELDTSGDGKIDFKEFAYFMVPIIIEASSD